MESGESRVGLLSEERRPEQQSRPAAPIQAEVIVRGSQRSTSDDEATEDSDGEFHDAESGTPGLDFEPGSLRHRQSLIIRRSTTSVDGTSLLTTSTLEMEVQEVETNLERELSVADEAEFACFPHLHPSISNARDSLKKMWESTHFSYLPEWLQDNDYLHSGHRPPLPSFSACFKSIFRLHTETGNIWSHMLGCVAFMGVAAWFLTRPETEVQTQEKIVFAIFFLGAILCLGFSSAFHTVHCHSPQVGKLFSKLDYCGISCMIVGSFVPWLFYSFYCLAVEKWAYMVAIGVLGGAGITVSMWDKFAEPAFRPIRAGVFIGLGLSGVVPCIHYVALEGWYRAFYESALGYLVLMAALYILGALMYACRVPERWFPGKCDIWFQSHQIFHLFVVLAAFVHYHGITEMAVNRLQAGACPQLKDLPA